MRIHQETYEHPTMATRVRLNLYEQQVAADVVAADDAVRGSTGYLVTEDRLGSSKVVRTLGFHGTKDQAMAQLKARAGELASQRWRTVSDAA